MIRVPVSARVSRVCPVLCALVCPLRDACVPAPPGVFLHILQTPDDFLDMAYAALVRNPITFDLLHLGPAAEITQTFSENIVPLPGSCQVVTESRPGQCPRLFT